MPTLGRSLARAVPTGARAGATRDSLIEPHPAQALRDLDPSSVHPGRGSRRGAARSRKGRDRGRATGPAADRGRRRGVAERVPAGRAAARRAPPTGRGFLRKDTPTQGHPFQRPPQAQAPPSPALPSRGFRLVRSCPSLGPDPLVATPCDGHVLVEAPCPTWPTPHPGHSRVKLIPVCCAASRRCSSPAQALSTRANPT